MASVKEYAEARKAAIKEGVPPVPSEVLKKVERAEKAIAGDSAHWREALCFFGNDQWVEISAVDNSIDRLEAREGGTKPRYRSRLTRNKMTPAIMREASMLSARVPGYEVTPSTTDQDSRTQAAMSEKVLRALHDKMNLSGSTIDTILFSINTGAGFSMPFWNPKLGEQLGYEAGRYLKTGDVDAWVLHQGEVLWEGGVNFSRSDWFCVKKARNPESVVGEPGYQGPRQLTADAKAGTWERPGNKQGELVFEHNFFEQPCDEYPEGRWLRYCNGMQTFPERPWPRKEGKPILFKLPWIPQRNKHRDLGAGEMLCDIQRTIQRTVNQLITWKNYCLHPQMIAPEGSLIEDPTDEDGVVMQYRPVAGEKPEWRVVPEIPTSIWQTLDRAIQDIDDVLGMKELPPGVESGTGIREVTMRESSFRDVFIRNLAQFYADQGEYLLELVQENYTEERLLPLQDRFGPEMIRDFLGRDLGNIGTVRVAPATVEPRTRQSVESQVRWFAEMGWIEKHEAMQAVRAGTADLLLDHFTLDIDKAHRNIRDLLALGGWEPEVRIRRAYEMHKAGGAVEDPAILLEQAMPQLPIAGPQDNHMIHIDITKQWMKTREYEQQPPAIQDAAHNLLMSHEMFRDLELQTEMARQQNAAEGLGAANASRPGGQKPMPSLPQGRTGERQVAGQNGKG